MFKCRDVFFPLRRNFFKFCQNLCDNTERRRKRIRHFATTHHDRNNKNFVLRFEPQKKRNNSTRPPAYTYAVSKN